MPLLYSTFEVLPNLFWPSPLPPFSRPTVTQRLAGLSGDVARVVAADAGNEEAELDEFPVDGVRMVLGLSCWQK